LDISKVSVLLIPWWALLVVCYCDML